MDGNQQRTLYSWEGRSQWTYTSWMVRRTILMDGIDGIKKLIVQNIFVYRTSGLLNLFMCASKFSHCSSDTGSRSIQSFIRTTPNSKFTIILALTLNQVKLPVSIQALLSMINQMLNKMIKLLWIHVIVLNLIK